MIYGYFDLSPSPYELSSVFLSQDEKVGIVYRMSEMKTFPSGLFYMEDLPPMGYGLTFFHASGKSHSIDFENLIDLQPGSMVFVGSYV